MKAVFFHDSKFYKKEGRFYTGGSLSYELLSKRYLSFFDEITVVARHQKYIKDKRPVLSSGNRVTFNTVDRLLGAIFPTSATARMISDEIDNADISIVRLPSIIGLRATSELRKKRKPYIVEMVGCAFDGLWFYGKLPQKLAAIPLYLANRYAVKRAPNVIYVTEEFLQKRYPNNRNQLACSDVEISASGGSPRKRAHKTVRLGTIANVSVPYKGHEYVIKGISELARNYSTRVEYSMVGAGDPGRVYALADKYGIRDMVHYEGIKSRDAIDAWLKDIDIYTQLSLQEGLPRALIEAMNMGCVSVCSKVGGVPELLDIDMIVPKKDYKIFAKKVHTLIKNAKIFKEQSEFNLKQSAQYDSSVLLKKYSTYMKGVIKNART